MANLTESPVFESGVFRLETTTPVKGGPPLINSGVPSDGFSNVQAQQLANRTAYLKQQTELLDSNKEQKLIAGDGITIDRTDPSAPVISSTGGAGGGAVDSVDGQTGVVDLSGNYAPLSHVGSRGNAHTNATTTEAGFMSAADKTKLNGVAPSATANQTDVYLLDRTNHTGTQAIGTVIGLQAALDDKEHVLTAGTNVVIDRTDPLNPIINATLSGGGGGDVVGPASSVNDEVALFDGVTGKLIKGGGILGDAAFTSAASYATSTQGGLADTAVQPGDLATVATTGAYSDLSGLPTLGTAASTDATAYATSTQGSLADTALQPDGIGVSVQAYDADTAKTDVAQTFTQVQTFGKAVLETKTTISASNIDLTAGSLFTKTISAATTFTVSNTPTSGTVASFVLELTNGGAFSVAWWTGVKWPGGIVPALTASGKDILFFYTHDGGVTWNAMVNKDVK